jgi:hypothetical protein
MKIMGAAAPSLAPEIAPSFDVNQQDDAQLNFLRGEKLAGYGTSMSAAVGFYSTGALRNPAGSGVLLIVKSLYVFSTANVNVSLSQISALTNDGSCTVLDGRWAGLSQLQTAGRYSWRNDSAGPLTGSMIRRWGGEGDERPFSAVLPPNFALVIETQAVNQSLNFGFTFVERAIPAEELATG